MCVGPVKNFGTRYTGPGCQCVFITAVPITNIVVVVSHGLVTVLETLKNVNHRSINATNTVRNDK